MSPDVVHPCYPCEFRLCAIAFGGDGSEPSWRSDARCRACRLEGLARYRFSSVLTVLRCSGTEGTKSQVTPFFADDSNRFESLHEHTLARITAVIARFR